MIKLVPTPLNQNDVACHYNKICVEKINDNGGIILFYNEQIIKQMMHRFSLSFGPYLIEEENGG